MTDIILAFATPLTEWTVKPIWRQLSYAFHYRSNIAHLNRRVQELRDKRKVANLDMIDASRALQRIDDGVERWLRDVNRIIQEKWTPFNAETVATEAVCCNGWLPNLKCRHSLGRKAKKMTLEVDELLSKDITPARPASPPKVEFKPTEPSTPPGTNFHEGASSSAGTSTQEQPPASVAMNINFDSRRSTIRDVMEALKGNQFNPIIICGMGGIGKTTLMGQVFEKAKKEGLFDEYTKATLPLDKAPDVIHIQGELAEYLGKNILEDEKERGPRASKLRARLSERATLSQRSKKILVMLDNVSTTTPDFLWDIGIPPSCKLLVTSRQQDLFKDLDTRRNFPIHGLPDTDAWSLFKKTTGISIESDRELEVVAKEVLKECAGLPIAISTVGTALKSENIAVWKNALSELKKANPENVPGVIEHVYGKIKFSYECLPSEQAKSCFLLCCIFEESADIEIEDLVRYGLGLKLFKGIDTMVDGRNRVETLVQTLKYRFLLLESDVPECVRMHDVVRDVAVHIASEEFVEKKNDGVEKIIVVRDKAETVKLMDWPKDSGSERSIYCSSLSISGLCQLLLLRTLSTDELPLKPLSTIFNRMEDLKVLAKIQKRSILHRVSKMHMLSLVSSFAVLKNLQTLRLEGCDLECDVSVIGELRTLMILSLHESDIKQLPDTFKNLFNLRLLDLSKCRKLQIIPPGVISSLSRLEELYMSECFYNWLVDKLVSTETTSWISQLDVEERAGSEEVDKWKRINTLAVEQPANQQEINWLNTLAVEQPANQQEINWLNTLAVEQPANQQEINWLNTLAVEQPANQQEINWLNTLAVEQPANQVINWLLEDCEERRRWAKSMDWTSGILSELLSLSGLTRLTVFLPPLDILLTTDVLGKKLERFQISLGWTNPWRFGVPPPSENHLSVADLDASSLVGSNISWLLNKANKFVLSMKNLTDPLNVFDFANLKCLELYGCEALEYLIDVTRVNPATPRSTVFPVLESLEVIGATRLKEICHGELLHTKIPVLRSLVEMSIGGGCDNLRTLLSPSIARGLVKLQRLFIYGCKKIEEIVAAAEGDETEDDNIFPQLTYLYLAFLPNLRTLLSPSIARGLVKLETLWIKNCEKIEEIVAAAEGDEETEDDNIFPQLTYLHLQNLPNLRSFSQGKCNFKWPLVKFIIISGCCNMKKFCFGSVSIPWEVQLHVSDVGENVLQELKNSRKEK